jgi:hypothetical protein
MFLVALLEMTLYNLVRERFQGKRGQAVTLLAMIISRPGGGYVDSKSRKKAKDGSFKAIRSWRI